MRLQFGAFWSFTTTLTSSSVPLLVTVISKVAPDQYQIVCVSFQISPSRSCELASTLSIWILGPLFSQTVTDWVHTFGVVTVLSI